MFEKAALLKDRAAFLIFSFKEEKRRFSL